MSDASAVQLAPSRLSPEGLVLYPMWPAWRVLVAILGVAVVLSAVAMIVVALVLATSPRWDLFAFEAITLCAGVIAILMGAGRFREGPGLALLSVAGTVFAASVLGFVGVGQVVALKGHDTPLALRDFVLARIALAGAFAAIAALVVLTRNRASMMAALKSLFAWIPIAIILVATFKRGAIASALAGTPQWVLPTLGALAVVAMIGFLSAAAHMTIRAFELARAPEEESPAKS